MKIHRLLSEPREQEQIAAGAGVHARDQLNRTYGHGRWRKMKGIATVELSTRQACTAEVHWYEAHGIGRVDWKIKRLLD